MAMHVFRYRLKCLLRDTEMLFWTMAFPILLATMFYVGFGNLIGADASFEPVKVAVVNSPAYQRNPYLKQMLAGLSTPGADQLLDLTVTDEAGAERLLDKGSVAGIITVGDVDDTADPAAGPIRLTVTQSGLGQSILKAILDDYLHASATVSSVLSRNPAAIAELIDRLGSRESYTRQISYSKAMPDTALAYFYALVAMACLYTGFWGMRNTIDLQADLSDQGARRSVAPTHKLTVVLCDWAAAFLICFVEILVLLAYLAFALKIDFGDQIGYILLTCLAGCVAGVSFGTLLGTLFRKSEGAKVAALVGATNVLSFLAGLMFVNMKHIVARSVPILSYINPAALTSDALYSLYVFDDHRRFFLNIGLLCVISAVMCFVSYLTLRRERYASL
ncbi:MAG: ABC transporter permease [Firmicutes bacterium]|jgi:ABC-2 type transport system permease protein|nr:ABC transporter permease [Bacillota bacterium]